MCAMTLQDHIICVLEKATLVAIIMGCFIGSIVYTRAHPYVPPANPQAKLLTPIQSASAVNAVDIISLTNQNRSNAGVPVLTTSPLLTDAAQLKADDMAANSYYAHMSPDGKSPLYWLDLVGYHYINAGENLVIDRTTSEQVVDAWMNSPDHRENILRPQFTEIGVGTASGVYEGLQTIYVVQEFGMPMPAQATQPKSVAIIPKPTPRAVQAAVKPIAQATAKPNTITSDVPQKPQGLVAQVENFTMPLVPTLPTKALPVPDATSSTSTSPLSAISASTTVISSTTSSSSSAAPLFALPDVPVTPILTADPVVAATSTQTTISPIPTPFTIIVHQLNTGFQAIISSYVPL